MSKLVEYFLITVVIAVTISAVLTSCSLWYALAEYLIRLVS